MPTDGSSITPAVEAAGVPPGTKLELFHLMLLQRLTEERIIALYRQGRIVGSVYTGFMQEAVAAGAGLALGPDDVVAPLNRELACHYARGVTVAEALKNFLGKGDGPTLGRDGNMHFGVPSKGVFPLVSMLGDLVPVVVGAALAFKRRNEPRVAMTFFGDGAMSTGDVHEGLNLAGVLQVPAVFVIQSNRYAYSTPTERQMVNTDISQRIAGGWSIPCERVDGTDALAVYETVSAAVERARSGGGLRQSRRSRSEVTATLRTTMPDTSPTSSGARFADPVERLAARLRLDGMSDEAIEGRRITAAEEVAAGLAEAEAAPAPDPALLEHGVYATPIVR